MEKDIFILETENGPITCEIIENLYINEYQKNYVIYTDHTKDENNELNLYISSYDPQSEKHELEDIKDSEELEKVANIIDEMWSEEDGKQ
ncbi:MAG: DUF1292 domain-containing protein [Bacilli bacterium]|nr:DUF1292 domain-containing protein [Bacilli bacterium]